MTKKTVAKIIDDAKNAGHKYKTPDGKFEHIVEQHTFTVTRTAENKFACYHNAIVDDMVYAKKVTEHSTSLKAIKSIGYGMKTGGQSILDPEAFQKDVQKIKQKKPGASRAEFGKIKGPEKET